MFLLAIQILHGNNKKKTKMMMKNAFFISLVHVKLKKKEREEEGNEMKRATIVVRAVAAERAVDEKILNCMIFARFLFLIC
jgi:hypothetical protein